jgi:hypothetical protein
MGHSFKATCKECQAHFEADEGGGFFFHLLRCDRCGAGRTIGFEEIGEPHHQYLKGLGGPYCVASSEGDDLVRKSYPGEPMTEEQYHQAVEQQAGNCECGGRFAFDAPLRCPQCRSTDIEEGEILIMYD